MMSMYRVFSCVVGKGCLLWPVCSLDKTVSLCLASLENQNLPVILCTSWLPTFAFQSPMMKRTSFLVLVLKGFIVFIEPINVSFFSISGWSIDLDYYDVEWFALKVNWDHSVIFEVAPKCCILDSFIDYEDYSIYSKGFLSTVLL